MSGRRTLTSDDGQDREDITRNLGASALRLCSISETSELLGVSRWQVYQLMNQQELVSVKIGRRRLIPLVELRTFIERRRSDGVPA